MNKIIIILLFVNNCCYSQTQTCATEEEIPSSTPNSRFIDNGNSTVSDNETILMWQKCQFGQSGINCGSGSEIVLNWQQALDEANTNMHAGYNDWRLPNYKELLSLVEIRCHNPSINISFFPNTAHSVFWTSSPYAVISDLAWQVSFSSGGANRSSLTNNLNLRLVRSE